jgi:hypothetical protein
MLPGAVTRVVVLGCSVVLFGCANHKLEREFFFKNPAATRVDRLRQYSLEDQYRLFRYGNDKIEPPLMGLARPIAERGKTVIPFLLEKLDQNRDDLTVRDIILIFDTMAAIKSYNVKSDSLLMETLHSRVSAMKNADWKAVCSKTISSIEAD